MNEFSPTGSGETTESIKDPKKKNVAASGIAGLAAKNLIESPKADSVPVKAPVDTLWERLDKLRESKTAAAGDTTDRSRGPAGNATEAPGSSTEAIDGKERGRIANAGIESDAEAADEHEHEHDAENLTPDEARESVLPYIDARLKALKAEASQVDEDAETDATSAVETAAVSNYLQNANEEIAADPTVPVEEAIDRATERTLETLETDIAATEDVANEEARDTTTTESLEEADETDDVAGAASTMSPAAGSGGAGAPAGPMPPSGFPVPSGPGGTYRPGGPRPPAPGGHGGPSVPHGPGMPPVPPGGFGGFPPIPGGPPPIPGGPPPAPGLPLAVMTGSVAPAMVTTSEALAAQRRAAGQGLLVGGIVGYLIGKRRGRIKTEKKLLPIQTKLEKQVTGLHQQVALKEQQIRNVARQKVENLARPSDKVKLKERLQKAITPPLDTLRQPSLPRTKANRQVERAVDAVRSEKFGRLLVEAPAGVLAGVALSANIPPQGRRHAGESIAVRPAETRPLPLEHASTINLRGRNVDMLSRAEVDQVADKLKIEGISLKELQQSHRLDERAVRRVLTEYLRGGNAGEALARELREVELKFEKDPHLKQAAAGGAAAGGASYAAAAIIAAQVASERLNGLTAADQLAAITKTNGQPAADPATIAALKRQQTMVLAAATLLFVVATALVILLLG